jgi:hypothetical protein
MQTSTRGSKGLHKFERHVNGGTALTGLRRLGHQHPDCDGPFGKAFRCAAQFAALAGIAGCR